MLSATKVLETGYAVCVGGTDLRAVSPRGGVYYRGTLPTEEWRANAVLGPCVRLTCARRSDRPGNYWRRALSEARSEGPALAVGREKGADCSSRANISTNDPLANDLGGRPSSTMPPTCSIAHTKARQRVHARTWAAIASCCASSTVPAANAKSTTSEG